MEVIRHHVAGEATGSTERTGPVFDPATGEQRAEVTFASSAEVDAVIASAVEAQRAWAATGLVRRADVLFRMRQLLVERADELAAVITSEHGKVIADAKGEISRGIENVEFASGLVNLLKGEHATQVASGVDVHTLKQPVGVVGAITPFNFPVMVPLWMAASAIACGNAVILKPSEKDPSSAVFLARLWEEAGLPAGVLNVVHGDKEAVDAILDSPQVGAVSFVGSTPIARSIYERAAGNGKRVQALGGAKNHMIVMPDADLDGAADAAVSAAYGSAGERCMAISVLVAVGAETADALVAKVTERIGNLRIGPGTDPASEMGPLITREHREKVASYVTGAPAEGATVVVDGTAQEFDGDGYFIGVSLVDHVKPGMKVYSDEIFGPVLSVVRVDSYDEAVALVNANSFANGTAIFTRDGGTARRFELDIQVGMVGINVPLPVPIGAFSFGGWKQSLFGDSHIYGPESIHFYTRSKVVTTRWPLPSESQIDLGFPSNH
ncbi:CoA-acylating methylmalonate-semialdehyde dehydrogenase [Demequina sp. SYSU T00068]|uniref:CoA-acylating methylmalonate-semialdehyde dehydrogenase n=1 Tax=Demequina lignilytica TaxID=3051663 RepID=UPI0026300AE3|nr:CoA-acylating methylmalonate-semialdehyde dehydrogenase [Demequina sp. SYSU T00068]MDN4491823.1 CoA-acylating methylmalonate-semialdehyde dehydrogenase [Demequina sp. SYSU T00068]